MRASLRPMLTSLSPLRHSRDHAQVIDARFSGLPVDQSEGCPANGPWQSHNGGSVTAKPGRAPRLYRPDSISAEKSSQASGSCCIG